MASCPIISWQIDGETMDTVRNFILRDSDIIADGDYSHKIKRCLLFGRKAVYQPREHIKKQRHCFAERGPSSQIYDFPVAMYGCESWTIKKAEH